MDQHLLSIILFAPLACMLVLLLIPSSATNVIKLWANLSGFICFLVSIPLVTRFDKTADGYQMVEQADWIPSLGVKYLIGVDGISMLLVMLTTVVSFLAILSAWNAIDYRLKEYYAMFLLLETGMIGVFLSLDFFLFYVFWELVLVPMYFIIGVWGGPRKLYAAIKFVLYTLCGSVLMLLGILCLYFAHFDQFGFYTFEIAELMKLDLPLGLQQLVFWAFFLGFAIKVPMFPFHTWLPDAHVEAPTGGSVVLASVMLKMGTYGFLRFSLPLLPKASADGTIVKVLAVLSIVGITY
jgi:NADH-quinone oxidoreductase subunit M